MKTFTYGLSDPLGEKFIRVYKDRTGVVSVSYRGMLLPYSAINVDTDTADKKWGEYEGGYFATGGYERIVKDTPNTIGNAVQGIAFAEKSGNE